MTESGLRVFVDQTTRRNQVTRDRIGGGPIQSAEFTADFGCQLLSVHTRRYRRAIVRPAIAVGVGALRLGWACPAGARPRNLALGARPTSRCAAGRRARSSLPAATLSVVDHSCRSPRLLCWTHCRGYGHSGDGWSSELGLEPVSQQRRHY
jgi:hypothetical protein